MLHHHIPEQLSKHVGGLLDDAGVGDDMDHPAFAVALCVVERESHASQGLAAASGHAEGEVAGIAFCGDSALAQYPCACAIHRCIRCADRKSKRLNSSHSCAARMPSSA